MGARDFPPSDKQLVDLLRHKILGNDNEVFEIAEIDYICNYEPWYLPMLAVIFSEDTWHYFSHPDLRYGKSGKNNRVTGTGSWKVTGKEREIKNGKNQVIGFKKILVFYKGRGRAKVLTDWKIHEYHLNPSCSNGRDYVLSCLHLRHPKKTVNSVVNEVESGYDSLFQVENTLANMTFAEIAPQCMVLDSNAQDFTSPIAQQPEMDMSQDPSYENLQYANGVTDTMLLPQLDNIYWQDQTTEAVKFYPPIQDVKQLYSSTHAAPEESSLYGSLSSLHIGDISDIEAREDGCLPEMHLMEGPFYENLQQTNCVADEDNLLLSQFGTSCQQDNILEVNSYPAIIEDVQSYCGSMQFPPSDLSPSESSGSQHVEDINHTEAINMFSPCRFETTCFETALLGDNEWLCDWSFEPGSAYFS